MENRSLSKINSSKDVLVEIAQVVRECSQFVIKYPETKTFCESVVPVISIASPYLRRVLSRESCSLGDSYQSRQLQLGVAKADAKASRLSSSKHSIWCQTHL